jgi:hypothetical protein
VQRITATETGSTVGVLGAAVSGTALGVVGACGG